MTSEKEYFPSLPGIFSQLLNQFLISNVSSPSGWPHLSAFHKQETEVTNTQDSESITLSTIVMYGQPLVYLTVAGQKRLCLTQVSRTLLNKYSYNEIHNRRVALGITCVQCSPAQTDLFRRSGAMPADSRRCGTITVREAERLVKSFIERISPPRLPPNFVFHVKHRCGWGSQGQFIPNRYNSSRAKCIRCGFCQAFFSPNKFIFHCHRPDETGSGQTASDYRHPDAANFNAWRRHLHLVDRRPSEDLLHAWEDVKAMFNGGNRKRKFTEEDCGSPKQLGTCSDHESIQQEDESFNQAINSSVSSDGPQDPELHDNNEEEDLSVLETKRNRFMFDQNKAHFPLLMSNPNYWSSMLMLNKFLGAKMNREQSEIQNTDVKAKEEEKEIQICADHNKDKLAKNNKKILHSIERYMN